MKEDVKREWIAALRSGEYKQARNTLCTADGAMCCLGVLIDISQDGYWELCGDVYLYDGFTSAPSYAIRHEVGLGDNAMYQLTARNDGVGGQRQQSFRQIANFIEANL